MDYKPSYLTLGLNELRAFDPYNFTLSDDSSQNTESPDESCQKIPEIIVSEHQSTADKTKNMTKNFALPKLNPEKNINSDSINDLIKSVDDLDMSSSDLLKSFEDLRNCSNDSIISSPDLDTSHKIRPEKKDFASRRASSEGITTNLSRNRANALIDVSELARQNFPPVKKRARNKSEEPAISPSKKLISSDEIQSGATKKRTFYAKNKVKSEGTLQDRT